LRAIASPLPLLAGVADPVRSGIGLALWRATSSATLAPSSRTGFPSVFHDKSYLAAATVLDGFPSS
jgi:hypothetical protein